MNSSTAVEHRVRRFAKATNFVYPRLFHEFTFQSWQCRRVEELAQQVTQRNYDEEFKFAGLGTRHRKSQSPSKTQPRPVQVPTYDQWVVEQKWASVCNVYVEAELKLEQHKLRYPTSAEEGMDRLRGSKIAGDHAREEMEEFGTLLDEQAESDEGLKDMCRFCRAMYKSFNDEINTMKRIRDESVELEGKSVTSMLYETFGCVVF